MKCPDEKWELIRKWSRVEISKMTIGEYQLWCAHVAIGKQTKDWKPLLGFNLKEVNFFETHTGYELHGIKEQTIN